MSHSYVLTFPLVLLMVITHLANSVPMELTFEEVDIQNKDEVTQLGIQQVDDRSSNLKFVLAIQSSGIWSQIKKRTLTIKTISELGEITEKSPNNLSDDELLKLKKACHDGLKCVAVDQLLVLKTYMEQTENGMMSVRTVITKITQVISEYTTEYHQNEYEYKEVKESDNPLKINETLTTIVKDNKELCQIDVDDPADPADGKNSTNDNESSKIPTIVNYGTINNYNINEGTINSATINTKSSDGNITKESFLLEPSNNNDAQESNILIVMDPRDGNTDQSAPELLNQNNDAEDKAVQENTAQNITSNCYKGKSTINNPEDVVDDELAASTSTTTTPKTDNNRTSNLKNNNYVSLNNSGTSDGNDCGCTGSSGTSDSTVDIASSGSFNNGNVRKGYVENGNINNGQMKEFKLNKGAIIKGKIDKTDADGGIVSVGLTNNGPVNYGTCENSTNDGTKMEVNNCDMQKYISSIGNAYSTILDSLNVA